MKEDSEDTIAMPQFLDYKTVYVNFIYSFTWDVTKKSFASLTKELTTPSKGWKAEKLHQRYIEFNGDQKVYGAYRPSLLVGGQNVLYMTDHMSDQFKVITPIKDDWFDGINQTIIDNAYIECNASLKYYIRFLENGAGVCTLTVCLDKTEANFINIHNVLHLGQNVSFGDNGKPLVCSFFQLKENDSNCWIKDLMARNSATMINEDGESNNIIVARAHASGKDKLPANIFTLQELFNRLLLMNINLFPANWIVPKVKSESIWLDWALSEWEERGGAYAIDWLWQSPYVFTICELASPLVNRPGSKYMMRDHKKELATILTKMNLNNAHIESDFTCIGKDYISKALPYNENNDSLLNLSHDDRLFFSFSRRGALVVTAEADKIPGYFVLPSFVNLLEILRARWHLGNIVNLELDAAIEALVTDEGSESEDVLVKVYCARMTLAMFMRDPVPYLFDGGAVTEIAQLAETELWLTHLRTSAHEKLMIVDKLIQHVRLSKAYESIKRRMGLEKTSNVANEFENYLNPNQKENVDDTRGKSNIEE